MTHHNAWDGFTEGDWTDSVDVRDFIQKNYSPYDGDEEFLSGPTDKTLGIWKTLEDNFLSVERANRVYDVDNETPAGITAFDAGYISDDDDVIVGLQTDVPLKRAMMPNGGWGMVETALREAGKEPDERVKEIFTKYRKTHNQGVFDAYTTKVRAARSAHIITGLPDAYGRGRIVPEVTRVALYGVDALIASKEADKKATEGQPFTSMWVQMREEITEQIKALKELKELGEIYGFDISLPASNAIEAVQWTYFAYLAAIKSQDGAAMSIGRLSPFFDIYIQRDLDNGVLTESEAQEIIDQFVLKLRIVRFLRTIAYDEIFSGDPYWATWTDGGFSDDGRHQVTKTSFRLLQTLVNLGPAPEPNITILWSENLPEGYREFCSRVSIDTSSLQYENDDTIRKVWGDNAVIACCVSPATYGKGVQHFGARANLAKTLLYGINGGRDEISGKQVIPTGIVAPIQGDGPLDYNEVWSRFDEAMKWVAETYIEALNIIHYMHDKYSYEAIEFALLDTTLRRVLGCGIAGLSVVTDSLSAIKYAKVTPVRAEDGLITSYVTEGDYPTYGNDDERADSIAQLVVKTFMDKIRVIPTYRDAEPTQSVLTITSNVVYGSSTGDMPASHKYGEPFAPGANPSNGEDRHGILASMMSVAKLDYSDALDGISLTSTIVPSGLGIGKEEQVKSLTKILDRAFAAGLYHTNINVLNRETLEDAMKHPEKYPNLTIRVSGYAVNFVKLTTAQQKDVLARTFHARI